MRDPNQAIGANLPVVFDPKTGLPQAISLGVQQNPVRYQPNLNDPALAGLPAGTRGQFAMQKLGPNPPSAQQIQSAGQGPGGVPAYFDPIWYVQNNPDILAGYNSQKDKKEGMDWYGRFHYNTFGKNEGRTLGPNDPKLSQQLAQAPQQQAPQQQQQAPVIAPPPEVNPEAWKALTPEQQMNILNLLQGMQAQQPETPFGPNYNPRWAIEQPQQPLKF